MNDTIASLASILGPSSGGLRFREAVITAVASDGSCTVRIAGDDVEVSEVNVAAHVCPVPNSTVWVATDGSDLFVIASLAPSGPGFVHTYRTTDMNISNTTWTPLVWTSLVTPSQYGGTVSSSGITVLVPGLWRIEGGLAFASPAGATGVRTSRVTVNGANVYVGANSPGTAAAAGRMPVGVTLKLAIGDVVNMEVWQNNGGTLALNGAADTFTLRATWVGPAA